MIGRLIPRSFLGAFLAVVYAAASVVFIGATWTGRTFLGPPGDIRPDLRAAFQVDWHSGGGHSSYSGGGGWSSGK